MSNQLYPSDLTDREWEYITPPHPARYTGGPDRKTSMRQVVNAVFYITRTGSLWRYLPKEYPPSMVISAAIQDRDGARLVLAPLAHAFTKLRKIGADSIYAGALVEWVRNLRRHNRIDLEIVKRSEGEKGFVVLPRRWVVERTFAWLE
jgi:transposase